MTSEAKKISITLVPGLEDMIQDLAEQRYGADARGEPVEVNLETLLPDLVNEGLVADLQAPAWPEATGVEFGPGEAGPDTDVRAAVEEAERQLSDPKVELPLEVRPEGPGVNEPEGEKLPTFEELTGNGRVHPDAVSWAKGNPSREAALVETCLGLHPALWGLNNMPRMVERTYNARTQGSDV